MEFHGVPWSSIGAMDGILDWRFVAGLISVASAFLSLFGAVVLISSYLLIPPFRTVPRRLLTVLSVVDAVYNMARIALLYPSGGFGHLPEAWACQWDMLLSSCVGTCTLLWTIATYVTVTKTVVNPSWKLRQSYVENLLHVVCWGYPVGCLVTMLTMSTDFEKAAFVGCWIPSHVGWHSTAMRWATSAGPLFLTWGICLALFLYILVRRKWVWPSAPVHREASPPSNFRGSIGDTVIIDTEHFGVKNDSFYRAMDCRAGETSDDSETDIVSDVRRSTRGEGQSKQQLEDWRSEQDESESDVDRASYFSWSESSSQNWQRPSITISLQPSQEVEAQLFRLALMPTTFLVIRTWAVINTTLPLMSKSSPVWLELLQAGGDQSQAWVHAVLLVFSDHQVRTALSQWWRVLLGWGVR